MQADLLLLIQVVNTATASRQIRRICSTNLSDRSWMCIVAILTIASLRQFKLVRFPVGL
jgi:hypothetical protein